MQAAQILQDPKPVYLLASSEPLLLRDWLDDARRALREQGFEDIVNLQSDSGFDWNELLEDSGMMSLFASRKCRIADRKNAIRALCDQTFVDSALTSTIQTASC